MRAWGVPGMKLFHLYLISLTIRSSNRHKRILRGDELSLSGCVEIALEVFSMDLCLDASVGIKFEQRKYWTTEFRSELIILISSTGLNSKGTTFKFITGFFKLLVYHVVVNIPLAKDVCFTGNEAISKVFKR